MLTNTTVKAGWKDSFNETNNKVIKNINKDLKPKRKTTTTETIKMEKIRRTTEKNDQITVKLKETTMKNACFRLYRNKKETDWWFDPKKVLLAMDSLYLAGWAKRNNLPLEYCKWLSL